MISELQSGVVGGHLGGSPGEIHGRRRIEGIGMGLIEMTKWRTLVLATVGFDFSVVLSMVPIVLLATWVFQPHIAEAATESGFVGGSRSTDSAVASDD